MISLCAFLILGEPTFTADRFAMGERLKHLDLAWMATSDKGKRAAAVVEISTSVMSFFSANYGNACRAMDKAIVLLRSDENAGMALTFRIQPPVAQPGEKVELLATWAYDGGRPVKLKVAEREMDLNPGYPAKFEVTAPSREGHHKIEVLVDGKPRAAELSVVKDFGQRFARLEKSGSRFSRDMAAGMLEAIAGGETTVDFSTAIAVAERLLPTKAGQLQPEIRFAKQGSTFLRAAFPKTLSEPQTVVVALHGAGGSENLFFEGYGNGSAVREATRRGWAFVAPRASGAAAADSLAWVAEFLGKKPTRVFVMGHSMGGRLALGTGPLKPNGIALFAPASGSVPENLAGTPIIVAVGKQEMAMLKSTAQGLREKATEFREYDPCEHLMIVADAVPDAYKFFDRINRL